MSSETDPSSSIVGRFRGVAGRFGGAAVDGIRPVTERLDRGLQPLADVYNRLLGGYFGEMNGLQFLLLFGSLLSLVTIPFWGNYHLAQATWVACIWAIFAMSWDIQSGYTGYISFGHSVLSGGAAYTTAMLLHNVDAEMSVLITAPLSVFVALVIGLLIALPSLRLSGPYFSLITFVAVLIFYRLLRPLSEYTGGELGISGIETFYSTDPVMRTYLFMIPMLVIALGLLIVARSNIGLILVAIRENESAVEAAGINATKFKIWSFILSAIPMGIGGVLLAHRYGSVDPGLAVVVDNSIEMIAMAVVGGMSSILGPLGGAFFIIMLEDVVLGAFELDTQIRWAILWVLVIGVLVFARDGLFRKLWHGLDHLGGDRE